MHLHDPPSGREYAQKGLALDGENQHCKKLLQGGRADITSLIGSDVRGSSGRKWAPEAFWRYPLGAAISRPAASGASPGGESCAIARSIWLIRWLLTPRSMPASRDV